jgi:DNA polymerase (family 10)
MDRASVADALDEIALLLDLLGENPFKGRTYANAARLVRGLDEDLRALVNTGGIRRMRGIGPALTEKISTLVGTGSLPYLEALRAQVPAGMLEWLRIPGLGPKKARAIHVALGISTPGELEDACRRGRLRDLSGFGEATERKILDGIEWLREHAGRFLQPVVRSEAERLLAVVRAVPGTIRAEAAGSVRRRCETSKDIDLVVAAADSAPVMEAFASAPGVAEVIGRGPTKCSVRLAAGPSADLRVVPEPSFPFALAYFTGSKAHNIALRARAQGLDLKLNEYALTRDSDGGTVPCADEAEIYRALGLPWIPPEMREDQGEIEAAEAGRLPRLVDVGDLRGILHCHSNWSDGLATIEEMAHGARSLGMTYLGLSDHSQAAAYAGGLSIERFREQWAEIDALNSRIGGGFRVLKGVEVDVLPDGSLDFPDEFLALFEYVIASVHSRFNLGAEEQTERLVRAATNPFVDTLGHVTGRLLLARDPYPLELHRVLEVAAERGVAVEINSHPQRLDLDPPALRYGLARGMKTSVNPDAHDVEGLSDVRYGVGIARKGWCMPDDVLNAWPLDRLLERLAARRRDAGAGTGRVAVPGARPPKRAARTRRTGAAGSPGRGKGRKGGKHGAGA